MASYVFEVGQRVAKGSLTGTVTSMVPGNGSIDSEWYFVTWDNGESDRYMRNDISAI